MLKKYAIRRDYTYIFNCNHKSIKTVHEFAFFNKSNNRDSRTNEVLQYLYLTHNQIAYIHINVFIKLKNLQEIYLENNLLTIINNTMFNGNTNLELIDLTHNRIHEFNLNLNIFYYLRRVYLEHNLLEVLNISLFKEFILKKNFLGLNNNTFICDCDMYWLASMNDEIKSIIYANTNICSSSKLNTTSLECFIKNKTGSGDCKNITLPTCNTC